jgi:hypothetical protein
MYIWSSWRQRITSGVLEAALFFEISTARETPAVVDILKI